MTKAYHQNIRKIIESNISLSKISIKVVVAWFTSQELLGFLNEKLLQGCEVEIIISDHYENRRLRVGKFIKNGGIIKVYPTMIGKFLHHKFAIFDDKKIITGSYNWTNSAEFYNEEVIIESDESILVQQFNFIHNKLKNQVVNYEAEILNQDQQLISDSRENLFEELELNLMKRFEESMQIAVNEGAKLKVKQIQSFLNSYGAIGGAKKLIGTGTEYLQPGLIKLFEIGKIELSFESIILNEGYERLFDKDTLEKARQRLSIFN